MSRTLFWNPGEVVPHEAEFSECEPGADIARLVLHANGRAGQPSRDVELGAALAGARVVVCTAHTRWLGEPGEQRQRAVQVALGLPSLRRVETNTFGATSIAQDDYRLGHLAREMNVAAAQLARQACDQYSTPAKPRFVAGALGPTPRTASISPDVNDPAARNVTFDQLRSAYYEQAEGLLEGGADLFLVETIFDTLNAKAALFALDELMEARGERLPVIVSGTVTDASGRILSGQTVGAFWHSVRHAKPLAVGLNCALGAALMRPYIEELAKVAGDTYISCYPNAGLPNPMSETGFDETPEVTGGLMEGFAKEGFLNIAGGCCGTTPEHIAEIARRVSAYRPRSKANPLFTPLLAA